MFIEVKGMNQMDLTVFPSLFWFTASHLIKIKELKQFVAILAPAHGTVVGNQCSKSYKRLGAIQIIRESQGWGHTNFFTC